MARVEVLSLLFALGPLGCGATGGAAWLNDESALVASGTDGAVTQEIAVPSGASGHALPVAVAPVSGGTSAAPRRLDHVVTLGESFATDPAPLADPAPAQPTVVVVNQMTAPPAYGHGYDGYYDYGYYTPYLVGRAARHGSFHHGEGGDREHRGHPPAPNHDLPSMQPPLPSAGAGSSGSRGFATSARLAPRYVPPRR